MNGLDRNLRREILTVRRLTNCKKVVADQMFVDAVNGQSLDEIRNKTHIRNGRKNLMSNGLRNGFLISGRTIASFEHFDKNSLFYGHVRHAGDSKRQPHSSFTIHVWIESWSQCLLGLPLMNFDT